MTPERSVTIMQSCIEAYGACCKPICRELGMPRMAFDVLMFLSDSPEHCTAKEISRHTGFKETILSVNINKLVMKGYLERRGIDGDRRKVKLVCTEKARPVIQRGRKLRDAFSAALREGMTEEFSAFSRCLSLLYRNARQIQRTGIEMPADQEPVPNGRIGFT